MTSIEWLQEQLNPDMRTMQGNIIQGLLEEAKEMHKQEIEYHIVDTNEMISEDKILTEANYRYVIEDEIEAFIQGANWIQEKLKI